MFIVIVSTSTLLLVTTTQWYYLIYITYLSHETYSPTRRIYEAVDTKRDKKDHQKISANYPSQSRKAYDALH